MIAGISLQNNHASVLCNPGHYFYNNYLMCLQDNNTFSYQSYSVLLVDQVYDYLSESYKYIYAIEVFTGEKGVLLTDGIVQSSFFAN